MPAWWTSDTISLNGNEPIAEIDGSTGSTDTTTIRVSQKHQQQSDGRLWLCTITVSATKYLQMRTNNGKMDLGESAIPTSR
ncbi:MAG: hypothetical protein IPF93_22135 [Saprospiraceae bacterium]|nr:hypothetical protein [Saprospiraceae bacterium]